MNTKNIFFKKDDQIIVYIVELLNDSTINKEDLDKIIWILKPAGFVVLNEEVVLSSGQVFVGPNLRFETPESEKLRSIFLSIGLSQIKQIEKFIRVSSDYVFDQMTESIYDKLPTKLQIIFSPKETRIIDIINDGKINLENANKEFGMGMDQFDIDYYYDLFVNKYKRNPTEVELMQIAQGNSSHSRHWEFGGNFIIDGLKKDKTLFNLVKDTLKKSPNGSVKAFSDNGGIIEGETVPMFFPDEKSNYIFDKIKMNHTATAETHNHPTLISPYPGASTGVGGRLRDTASIGRGSLIGFGGVYFQTGKLWLDQKPSWNYPKNMANPLDILIGSIKGATGYGNPFGEPTLLFGNDSLGYKFSDGKRFETIKPIIYTSAVGSISGVAKDKIEGQEGMYIVRIGGATRRVGVGGGAASSIDAGKNDTQLDFKSVQRGEPMIGRSAYNVIEHCVFMGDRNPIQSIHDQGAGGASNVLTELINPCGGIIDIQKIQIGDSSMSQAEIWVAESQELYGILIAKESIDIFKNICNKYNCPIEILGETNNSQKIVVKDSRDSSVPVDLTLPEILGKLPQKTYTDETINIDFEKQIIPDLNILDHLMNVSIVPGVSFLNYMTDHFDGSVGGRVVQGPRVGSYQLPVCNYGILSDSFDSKTGVVSTFSRTNPIAMLIDEQATSRISIANMILTLSFIEITGGIEYIKGRLNVMWPFKQKGMKAKLYSAYSAITDIMQNIGFGIDGGKDSLSMITSFDNETVSSFPTFITTAYVHLKDFRSRVQPVFLSKESEIILIELKKDSYNMGGSAMLEAYDQTGNSVPDIDGESVKTIFSFVQSLVKSEKIISGAPKTKGGLFVTISKLAMANDIGVRIEDISTGIDFLFNEEIGIVLQVNKYETKDIITQAESLGLRAILLGSTNISYNKEISYFENKENKSISLESLRQYFSTTSNTIKKHLGINQIVLDNQSFVKQNYKLTYNPDDKDTIPAQKIFNVAILRAPGTNGHHELAFMFGRMKNKFNVKTVLMQELLDGHFDLKDFNVIAFAGGFSYGDVGDSGKGWAASIIYNEKLKKMFDDFYAREDTMSFGVCNGFQVVTLLGVLDKTLDQQPRLLHNVSGIFEHRLVNLLIPENTNSIMFKDMQGSVLPAWSAHGEGHLHLPKDNYDEIEKSGLVAVYYADGNGIKTENYPANPNGTKNGIAGLCTKDGRHTFMMPHIERVSASNDHLPYKPDDFDFKNPIWEKAFKNMYDWLAKNK